MPPEYIYFYWPLNIFIQKQEYNTSLHTQSDLSCHPFGCKVLCNDLNEQIINYPQYNGPRTPRLQDMLNTRKEWRPDRRESGTEIRNQELGVTSCHTHTHTYTYTHIL